MDYYSSYSSYSPAAAGVSAGLMAVYAIVCLVFAVICIIAMVKIFSKAGKPGWHAIIPILNLYDEFEIAWGKGIMFLLMLIPGVNVVISIMFSLKLAKAFGKSTGFAVGLIFLPFVFMLILAFDKSQYIGPDGVPQNQGFPQQPYAQQPYQAPQQPYQAPQQPYQAPQQPYQAPQGNYPPQQQPPYGQQ
ncbi:MAG: hypothetical protein IJL26_06175 [Clostridia bacterium]|nr:hypothetical protein [Clostridia bacterium]